MYPLPALPQIITLPSLLLLLALTQSCATHPTTLVDHSLPLTAQVKQLLTTASSYQIMGQAQTSLQLLQEADTLANTADHKALQAMVKNALSDTLLLTKQLEPAKQAACAGLLLAQSTQQPLLIATLWNTLGNALVAELEILTESEANQQDDCVDKVIASLELPDNLATLPSPLEIAASFALPSYHAGLQIAQAIPAPSLTVKLLINLAQIYINHSQPEIAQTEKDKAIAYLRQAWDETPKLPANSNTAWTVLTIGSLLQQYGLPQEEALVYKILQQALQRAESLRDTLLVAETQGRLGQLALTQAEQLADTSKQLNNRLLLAYTAGNLGELYLNQPGHEAQAKQLFQQAIFEVDQVAAREIEYRWYWQLGRLYQLQGQREPAKTAYRQAIKNLQTIRSALNLGQRNYPKFRTSQGQVYLDLVTLLLTEATEAKSANNLEEEQKLLIEAISTLERFKVSELENYFRSDCAAAAATNTKDTTPIETLIEILSTENTPTAVFYPMILEKSTELLLILAKDKIYHVSIPIAATELQQQITDYQKLLRLLSPDLTKILTQGKAIYELLISPLEEMLQAHQIQTLVIVPDGVLRMIPFATLNTAGTPDSWLIKKYALAVIPGLTLNKRKAHLPGQSVLLSAVSKEICHRPALVSVDTFINKVKQQQPPPTVLVNEQFTEANLATQLFSKPYPMLIFATHGKFSGDIERSYLLSYDCELRLRPFGNLLRIRKNQEDSLDLLILSACETAMNSDQAALGLAGIGFEAGANSVLATLWQVGDKAATELTMAFLDYLKIHPQASKAQALQQVQLAYLADPKQDELHPFFWSPFIVIGDWR